LEVLQTQGHVIGKKTIDALADRGVVLRADDIGGAGALGDDLAVAHH
jgi:hypothetical protein